MMGKTALEMLAAAAESVVWEKPETLRPASYATWDFTCPEDEFDLATAIPYLRREGYDVDEELLCSYSQQNRKPIGTRGISLVAPWIECVGLAFVDYASFRQLGETPRYVGILTFTTPVISERGDSAFLEVCTEDGRYAQVGF